MMKHLLTTFLLLALLLPTTATAHDFEVDGIYYNINGNNATVTYKGTSSTEYSNEYTGDVTIPATVTYNGTTYSVTSIAIYAFYGCSGLTSITIPNSVTYIDSYAFSGCSGLTSVEIPNSVKYIYNYAFENCSSLTSINIPNSVTWIGIYAFSGCSGLTGALTIPNSVTHIGGSAFYNCSGLTGELTIPNSVTYIGNSAFFGCSGLTSITIPNSVTFIGDYAFYGCSGLNNIIVASDNPNYDSRNDCNAIIESSTNTLIAGCKNSTIPNSVTSIGNSAFYDCSGLTSITIPNSVTSIGNYAFQGCTALATLNYNAISCANFSSTETDRPFYNLNISTINIGDSVQRIPSYFAYGLTELTNLTIPNSVTSIGEGAFSGCSGLTSITIPNSVTTIGYWAFYNCSGLTSITIPNSVTTIGNYAFQGCTALATLNYNAISCADFSSTASYRPFYNLKISTINIGNSVQRIPAYFAYGLTELTNLTIPNSVTSIGDGAFYNCSGLTSIQVENGNPEYDSRDGCNAIIETSNNRLIAGCKNTLIPNSVTSIGNSAFYNCSGLTSVTIPNSVTSIGNYAFQGCTALATLNYNAISCADFSSTASYRPFYNLKISTINIGNSVQRIPAYFAYGLTELTNLTIGDSVTSIGNYAFSNCSGLTSLTIPNSVTTIGISSFSSCSGLTSIAIPNSVTSIGNNAFSGCSGLKSLSIPNSVSTIGNYAFRNCSSLTNAEIGKGVTSIGDFAFQGCTALATLNYNAISCADFSSTASNRPFYNLKISTIKIGDSVQRIPAFFVCGLTKVSNLSIGYSVTTLGNSAFEGCSGLTKVYISNIASWCSFNYSQASENPLYYACHLYLDGSEVNELVIPNSVTSVGNYAFYNCSNLTYVTIPNSVTSIGNYAFYNCSNLTNVAIPNSVTFVGNSAFNNCPAIGTVICEASTPPSWNALSMFTTNVYNHTPLYVPSGSETAYMADQCWGQFDKIRGIQDDVKATSVSLNQSQMNLTLGASSQLSATVLPDSTTNKVVSWASSAPTVASVDENGLVTALAVGTATITATTTDGTNLSASCTVTVTEDLDEYDNYLSLNDTEALHGDIIVIPVKMTNAESILSFQTDIYLPNGLEIVLEDGDYLINPSCRMTPTHTMMSNAISSGAIRVICYSSNYKPFTGNSGDDLFYITVKVADDAEGDYTISLKNTLFTNGNMDEISAPDVAANVHVKAYIPGDANGSGTVTVTDVVVTAQYVLEMNPQPFVFEAADMNADGTITVTDITRIAYLILNPTLNAPRRKPALTDCRDLMSADGLSLAAGETRTVSIVLDNDMLYSAFQLDLMLPDGLTASNFALTDRAGSHALDVNMLSNGKLRALCYSPTLAAIDGHEGALLTFEVTATGKVDGDIVVDGIELVTAACETVKHGAFTIGINNVTSVSELSNAKAVARVDYYNVAGQRLDRPEGGVTLVVTTYTDGTRTTTKLIR